MGIRIRIHEKGPGQVDHVGMLSLVKPVVQAYALGYVSAVVPRLRGYLRTLRRKDRTVEEKLEQVTTYTIWGVLLFYWFYFGRGGLSHCGLI